MQAETADASNSKYKRQHWINSNQIIEKTNRQLQIFQKNPSKTKGEEKRIADTIEESQGKIHTTGKYGRKGKGVGLRGFWEGEVRYKHGKYGIRKCRRKRKYMVGKSRGT